jgi:peptide/nickel transport system permease protein
MISSAMITESSLSFLGAGVQPPMASWGNIVHNATNVVVLYMYPWEWLPAGIMLIITVVCINFVGEGVRDALDPKMRR